jgi:hypothetical protein
MDKARHEEVKRLTHTMWSALRYAGRLDGNAEVGGNAGWMRSVNVLVRRGFCTLQPIADGYHRMKLTKAGFEALVLDPMEKSK